MYDKVLTNALVYIATAVDVEHSHVRFLGNLVLNLWDCGGYVFLLSLVMSCALMPTRLTHSHCAALPTTAATTHSQDAFYENYFESQRDHIFRSVELLIYVFDIESREIDVRPYCSRTMLLVWGS